MAAQEEAWSWDGPDHCPPPTEAFAGHSDQALEVGEHITLGRTVPRERVLCESSSDGEVRRWVIRPGISPAPLRVCLAHVAHHLVRAMADGDKGPETPVCQEHRGPCLD